MTIFVLAPEVELQPYSHGQGQSVTLALSAPAKSGPSDPRITFPVPQASSSGLPCLIAHALDLRCIFRSWPFSKSCRSRQERATHSPPSTTSALPFYGYLLLQRRHQVFLTQFHTAHDPVMRNPAELHEAHQAVCSDVAIFFHFPAAVINIPDDNRVQRLENLLRLFV